MAQLHSRSHKGNQITGVPAITPPGAVFNSTTGDTPTGEVSDTDVTTILRLFPDTAEVGEPGIQDFEDVAGDVTTVLTVPSGKFWRLIGISLEVVTDSNAATRTVLIQPRNAADVAIANSLITMATQIKDLTVRSTVLFGAQNVGDAEDKASTLDGHTKGILLIPTDEIAISITNGLAGDDIDFYLFYVEYDNDPR